MNNARRSVCSEAFSVQSGTRLEKQEKRETMRREIFPEGDKKLEKREKVSKVSQRDSNS